MAPGEGSSRWLWEAHWPVVSQKQHTTGARLMERAVILKMSVFHPTRNFRQFWADPIFSAVRSIFRPRRRPKMLKFYPTQNFGLFWAVLLKMSGFTPC